MTDRETYELLKAAVNHCIKTAYENNLPLDHIEQPLKQNGIEARHINIYYSGKNYGKAFRSLYYFLKHQALKDSTASVYSKIVAVYYQKLIKGKIAERKHTVAVLTT